VLEEIRSLSEVGSGDNGKEVTPVPMPNTAVKLFCADGSWRLPPARVGRCRAFFYIFFSFHSSSVVELSAVNRSVAGSNPACGAMEKYPSG
jgi:hypothetical protein